MSLFGVLLGTATAVPIGIFLSRRPKLSGYAIDVAGMPYTIPLLVVLGFLLPFMGLGWLPVLWNTYTGIMGVDASIKEAARGMGELIFQGISMMDNYLILAGTIPVFLMALFFDQILGLLERRLQLITGAA